MSLNIISRKRPIGNGKTRQTWDISKGYILSREPQVYSWDCDLDRLEQLARVDFMDGKDLPYRLTRLYDWRRLPGVAMDPQSDFGSLSDALTVVTDELQLAGDW